MIQNAFVGAYTREVGARNKGISTITSGVKDAATLAMGVAGLSGALGDGAVAEASEHMLAGRVGGIGGNIMLATMKEKQETIKAKEKLQEKNIKQLKGLQSKAAKVELRTPAEILHTSWGDFPADSEMGKKIKQAEEVEK